MNNPYERVVIRFKDGRMLKCEIHRHFSFTLKTFKAITREGKVQDVDVDELKAVFFVQELEGLSHVDTKAFHPGDPRAAGRRVEVELDDGEILRGRVLGDFDKGLGFFLESADPKANNRRVFVVRSAVKVSRFLEPQKGDSV